MDKITEQIEADLDPLEEENRALKIQGDQFEEDDLEREEQVEAEGRDVNMADPESIILPSPQQIPEGMAGADVTEEGDLEVEGEDLETGEGAPPHAHHTGTDVS